MTEKILTEEEMNDMIYLASNQDKDPLFKIISLCVDCIVYGVPALIMLGVLYYFNII